MRDIDERVKHFCRRDIEIKGVFENNIFRHKPWCRHKYSRVPSSGSSATVVKTVSHRTILIAVSAVPAYAHGIVICPDAAVINGDGRCRRSIDKMQIGNVYRKLFVVRTRFNNDCTATPRKGIFGTSTVKGSTDSFPCRDVENCCKNEQKHTHVAKVVIFYDSNKKKNFFLFRSEKSSNFAEKV